MSDAERLANLLTKEEVSYLLDLPSDYSKHITIDELKNINFKFLFGNGLIEFFRSYEGPEVMISDLGFAVKKVLRLEMEKHATLEN